MALTPIEALRSIRTMVGARYEEIHHILYPALKKDSWLDIFRENPRTTKNITVSRKWLESLQRDMMGIGNGCSSSISAISD